jgi:hypothetical protein
MQDNLTDFSFLRSAFTLVVDPADLDGVTLVATLELE